MPVKKTESNIFSLFIFYQLQIVKTEEMKTDFVKWGRNGGEFVAVYFKGISSHSRESVELKMINYGLPEVQNEFENYALVINLEKYPWQGNLAACNYRRLAFDVLWFGRQVPKYTRRILECIISLLV